MGKWGLLIAAAAAAVALSANTAHGYDRYSVNGDATNCRSCHGDFRATSYTSLSDGMTWGSLHDLHRVTMLSGDCATCHGSGPRGTVLLTSSSGGDGLSALSCVGCHGRAEDNVSANPDVPGLGGYGAGLRQHHDNAGVTVCRTCHQDANPANYTPVGEHVLPDYYANPGMNHPNMPPLSCNPSGGEHFAGATIGLDNDGDGTYDQLDPDCMALPDAGVPDAGIVDAGVMDAGPVDAGVVDATTLDATSSDAGTVDAMIADAATSVTDARATDSDAQPLDAQAPGPDAPPSSSDAGTEPEDAGGCGCRSGESSSETAAMLLLAGLLALRRRRAPSRCDETRSR